MTVWREGSLDLLERPGGRIPGLVMIGAVGAMECLLMMLRRPEVEAVFEAVFRTRGRGMEEFETRQFGRRDERKERSTEVNEPLLDEDPEAEVEATGAGELLAALDVPEVA